MVVNWVSLVSMVNARPIQRIYLLERRQGVKSTWLFHFANFHFGTTRLYFLFKRRRRTGGCKGKSKYRRYQVSNLCRPHLWRCALYIQIRLFWTVGGQIAHEHNLGVYWLVGRQGARNPFSHSA